MVQICLNRTDSERVIKEPKLKLTGVNFFLRPNLIVARQSLYVSMGPNGFGLGIHNLLEMGKKNNNTKISKEDNAGCNCRQSAG